MKNLLIKNIGTLVSTYTQAPNKVAGIAMKEVPSIQSNCLEELVMKMKNIYKTLKN